MAKIVGELHRNKPSLTHPTARTCTHRHTYTVFPRRTNSFCFCHAKLRAAEGGFIGKMGCGVFLSKNHSGSLEAIFQSWKEPHDTSHFRQLTHLLGDLYHIYKTHHRRQESVYIQPGGKIWTNYILRLQNWRKELGSKSTANRLEFRWQIHKPSVWIVEPTGNVWSILSLVFKTALMASMCRGSPSMW